MIQPQIDAQNQGQVGDDPTNGQEVKQGGLEQNQNDPDEKKKQTEAHSVIRS
jgi:hypothetical protein